MRKPVVSFGRRKERVVASLALAVGMLWLLGALVTTSSQSAGPSLPGRHPRLESALRNVVAAHRAGDVATADLARQHGVTLVEDLVQVVVVGNGQVEPSAIAQQIAALGGQVETAHDPWTQARLPVDALLSLADTPGVRFVRRPWLPLPATTSEGVAVTHADEWHGAGLSGQGVAVGVLDVGFLGYSNRIGEGELPSDVITKSFAGSGSETDFWGGSSHGTACAEIVHDMAPGAQLYLVNFRTEVEWGNAVDWLLAQDVDVISFSAGWPVGGPGDGTGILAEKVGDARNAGALWVNAAGNSAQQHWMGGWNDPDGNGLHNYAGTDETNEISVSSEPQIAVGLRWNDPWGGSSNDYDLFLYYQETDGSLTQVMNSTNVQDGDDDPYELISYFFPSPGVYHVAIFQVPGTQPRTLELFSYYHDFHYRTASSSLEVPADSPGSLTIAATYWQDDTLENFSSQGPTRDGRIKPDLAAPDGVSVSTETWRFSGFFGTSASAPHAAGAAALALETLPTLTPAQLQGWLEDRAMDLGPAGKDNVYGAGRLNLQPAVVPGAALRDSTVTLAVSGIPFAPTATFRLAKPGYDDILPADVTWVSLSQLTGTVNLSGTEPGFWTAAITSTPSTSISLTDAFLVATDKLYLPASMRHAAP